MRNHLTSRSQYRPVPMAMGLIGGLVAAQLIGTLQVGWSNRALFSRTRAVIEAGYLAVPNEMIKPGLLSLKAALGGGLFFTLTIGAFLTLLTVGWLQLGRFLAGRRGGAVGIAVGMIAGLAVLNINGFNLFATAYVLFVPLVSGVACPRGEAGSGRKDMLLNSFCLLIPPIVLMTAWLPYSGHHIFTDVRDGILLSNSPGRWINDFYYRYTLYPAESFKSLNQKQIRTFYLKGGSGAAVLSGSGPSSAEARLVGVLATREYLPVATITDGDVVVDVGETDFWELKAKGRVVAVPPSTLLNRPDQTLQSLGELSDNNRWFRRVIYVSLWTGFPLLIYLIVFGAPRLFL